MLIKLDWITLAAEFGTPIVVLSRSQLRTRIREVHAAWTRAVERSQGGLAQPPHFYFPLKANDCCPLLLDLRNLGVGADVSDSRELRLAVRELCMTGTDIVVNGPAKNAALLAQAASVGARIHIDSLSEAHELVEIAKHMVNGARVGLRLRLFETSKFGLAPDDRELSAVLNLLQSEPSLHPSAIHQHDSSVLNSRSRLREATLQLTHYANVVSESSTQPIEIDLGGGLTLGAGEFQTVEDFAMCFAEIADEIQGGNQFSYAFEWGRAFVQACGVVLTRVVRIKHSEGQRWVFVDVGQNVFGGGHALVACQSITCVNAHTGELRPAYLAGPLCFSSDLISRNTTLPDDLKEGDLLLLWGAGAYTTTTRWSGPGTNPVLFVEDDGNPLPLGRLWGGDFRRAIHQRPLDDLFHLFFDEGVAEEIARADPDLATGVSSGVNQQRPPECLIKLHLDEGTSIGDMAAYTGPLGPEEVLVGALAYERALAGDCRIERGNCAVVAGVAQGVRRTLAHLSRRGFDHCLVLGPQYPWVYDVMEFADLGVEQIIGPFESGYVADEDKIEAYLRHRPRSIVFMTAPNNPSGACPDEHWLTSVCQHVNAAGAHLVVDRSSEDLPFADWVIFTPCTELLLSHLGLDHCTIVSSPSKSRSCPGLRLGYLIGSHALVQEVARHQYMDYLSLTRYGASFVASDLVLRALWWRMHRRGESKDTATDHVLRSTSTSHSIGIEIGRVLDLAKLLGTYTDQCRDRLEKIRAALDEFRSGLGQWWIDSTALQNGFNVVAELAWKGNSQMLARSLYTSLGLRVLPGRCFTLNGCDLSGRSGGTTIRLSCATDPIALGKSAKRIAQYLEKGHL